MSRIGCVRAMISSAKLVPERIDRVFFPRVRVSADRRLLLTEKFSGYFFLYTEKIMPGDEDEYGAEYSRIVDPFMPIFNRARTSPTPYDLRELLTIATEKREIATNAQYFAFNHIRSLAIISLMLVILNRLEGLPIARIMNEYVIPLYNSCKDEEAVCLQNALKKTMLTLTQLMPQRMFEFFMIRQKNNPTYLERVLIDDVMARYRRLLAEGKIEEEG